MGCHSSKQSVSVPGGHFNEASLAEPSSSRASLIRLTREQQSGHGKTRFGDIGRGNVQTAPHSIVLSTPADRGSHRVRTDTSAADKAAAIAQVARRALESGEHMGLAKAWESISMLPAEHAPALAQAAEKAVAFLAGRVLDDAWVSKHQDVGYYFKAPMVFLNAGREEDARKVLGVAVRQAAAAGVRSSNNIYSDLYPQYPWLWLCWAACDLGLKDVANQCFRSITTYAHPLLGTGLAVEPYCRGADHEGSFFATAVLAKAALLCRQVVIAKDAGDSLVRAVEANQAAMQAGKFRLRWGWEDGFIEDASPLHCVSVRDPAPQLYFMLGFPAVVLLELSAMGISKAKEYSAAAVVLLDFLKRCSHVSKSTSAHQVACAAAMCGNKGMSTAIIQHLLSLQRDAGCFHADLDSPDAMDVTAEVAFCLQEVRRITAGVARERDPLPAHQDARAGAESFCTLNDLMATGLPKDDGPPVARGSLQRAAEPPARRAVFPFAAKEDMEHHQEEPVCTRRAPPDRLGRQAPPTPARSGFFGCCVPKTDKSELYV